MTLKDVAAETGHSVSTVSRALADNPMIPAGTRATIQAAAQRLRYRPNAQAAALRKQRSNTIGVVIPDIQNPYFAALAAAIQRAAQASGMAMLLGHTNEHPDQLNAVVDTFTQQRVDGLIVVPHMQSSAMLGEVVQEIPLVAADRTVTGGAVPSVTSDPGPGMRAALATLQALPDARLGYLAGPQDTSTGAGRLEEIRRARHAGADIKVVQGDYDLAAGRSGTRKLLDQGVNAFLAGDAMLTTGCLQALRERGLILGKDVAVVGFDNLPTFALVYPTLALIDQHVEELGARAFSLLEQFIATGKPPDSVVIPTSLVPGGSAALAPGSVHVGQPATTH